MPLVDEIPEIDALNGHIARRGAELDVPVAVNHALFTLVKLAEQKAATETSYGAR